MQLLILAAGTGSRLSPKTDHLPKCLLEVDRDVTILDHQLQLAHQNKITDIVIVTGFKNQLIEKKLEEYQNEFVSIKTVYNPFYKYTNNLISLWLGLKHVDNDIIMMNADTIVHNKILKRILEEKDRILIPISKKEKYDSDDTKLTLDLEGQITNISKELTADKTNAEWMGVCLFPKNTMATLKKFAEECVKVEALTTDSPHYLSVFHKLIESGHKLETCEFDETFWAEIDYQSDLDQVRMQIKRYR